MELFCEPTMNMVVCSRIAVLSPPPSPIPDLSQLYEKCLVAQQ